MLVVAPCAKTEVRPIHHEKVRGVLWWMGGQGAVEVVRGGVCVSHTECRRVAIWFSACTFVDIRYAVQYI